MKVWSALIVALLLYALFQIVPLLKAGGGHANDFKHIYLGTMLLWEGENPYNAELLLDMGSVYMEEDPRFTSGILPYVYLPFTGMVLGPLATFDFAEAVIVWQLLNHVFLFAGLILAAYGAGFTWNWKSVALIAAAVVFNFSVYRQNSAGQLNMVLVFGYGLLFLSIVKEWKPWMQGLIAASLMLFKITPGIFLVYFLLRREWRQTAWMLVFAILLTIPAILLFGFDTHIAFLPLLESMGYGQSTWAEFGQSFWRDPYNQSINSFFHRLLVPRHSTTDYSVGTGAAIANVLTWITSLVFLAAFFWAFLRDRFGSSVSEPDQAIKPDNENPLFALAILTSLLIPSLMWDHYLVQALIPAIILWKVAKDHSRHNLFRGLLVSSLVLMSLGVEFSGLFIHFGLFEGFWYALTGSSVRLPTIPLGGFCLLDWIWAGLKLWPVLLLFVMALILARRGARQTNLKA